jgi:hypothetical protein
MPKQIITDPGARQSGGRRGERTGTNVKVDWNATSGDAEILNKPDLGVYHLDGGMSDSVYGGTESVDGGSAGSF